MSNVIPLPVGGELVSRVAANVRAECARRGYNQSDLARALGWAVSTVQIRWSGARQWQLEDLEQVAMILGLPAESLFAPPPGLEPGTLWFTVTPSQSHAAEVVNLFTRERVA